MNLSYTFASGHQRDGADLVVGESTRVAVTGNFADLAEALGVYFSAPPDPYPDGSEASATADFWNAPFRERA